MCDIVFWWWVLFERNWISISSYQGKKTAEFQWWCIFFHNCIMTFDQCLALESINDCVIYFSNITWHLQVLLIIPFLSYLTVLSHATTSCSQILYVGKKERQKAPLRPAIYSLRCSLSLNFCYFNQATMYHFLIFSNVLLSYPYNHYYNYTLRAIFHVSGLWDVVWGTQ